MRIRSLTVAGFRGFNEERTVDFEDGLTLVYGPNSYGKTSICEALEWLLFGATSKMRSGQNLSKPEFLGSYKNVHFPDDVSPYVEVVFADDQEQIHTIRGELGAGDDLQRFFDGDPVSAWAFCRDGIEPPFVLQHSIKDLLLAKPSDRYRSVAVLLGLDALTRLQEDAIAFQNKPPIPPAVEALRRHIAPLEGRLAASEELLKVWKAYQRGLEGLDQLWEAVHEQCLRWVSSPSAQITTDLRRAQSEARTKEFSKPVSLSPFAATDVAELEEQERDLRGFLGNDFTTRYLGLVRLSTLQHIGEQLDWFERGQGFLADGISECPFCGQNITDVVAYHIEEKHADLKSRAGDFAALRLERTAVKQDILGFQSRMQGWHQSHLARTETIVQLEPDLGELRNLFGDDNRGHWSAVADAVSSIAEARSSLCTAYDAVLRSLNELSASVESSTESSDLLNTVGDCLATCLGQSVSYRMRIDEWTDRVTAAGAVLHGILDERAGTESIGLLIDLIENRGMVEQKLRIDDIAGGISEFRKTVEQFVQHRIQTEIAETLTGEVLEWYGQIRTQGDPDVHFSGFDMGTTKKGDLQSRRVQVRARSYGKDLVSAVSCLSESKLNALGLSIAISKCLSESCPFHFIFVDDPIQSWDAEHEAQFGEVVRMLVSTGRQVVVLSHNKGWVEGLRRGCQSLNGCFYEITSYTIHGPEIVPAPWCGVDERLSFIDAVCKSPTASSPERENADAQFRYLINDQILDFCKRRGIACKAAARLATADVTKKLSELGFPGATVDHIRQIYDTSNSAHHHEPGYTPNPQRTRQYLGWVNNWLDEAKTVLSY